MNLSIELAERRLIPDRGIRMGIRSLLRKRLAVERERARAGGAELPWARAMATSPVALATAEANEQHYEVPTEFYQHVLGRNLKYSSALWPEDVDDLSVAEAAMLDLTVERAGLVDGQAILELGCGWGSLTLWMATRFPRARIFAVSNSATQRRYIEEQARHRGLDNVQVVTVDVNAFATDQRFDRVVSVEMFEHVRNWEALLARIHAWLTPNGQVFLHYFAHRELAYPFETTADDDWMGRHFFTGGMMPSHDLLKKLDIPFDVSELWAVDGRHYARTAEAWLGNLDRNRDEVEMVLRRHHEPSEIPRLVQRWRMFFLACAELFGFDEGRQWVVTHARLTPLPTGGAR